MPETWRVSFTPVAPTDVEAVCDFLRTVDLTLAGVGAPAVRLWTERDETGMIIGSTGYESSSDGSHALIRSVAVAPGRRTSGAGSRLATHALREAARSGATRAWLFSRRSGPFWEKLGFEPADRDELTDVLSEAYQVRLFVRTGRIHEEVAWSRHLDLLPRAGETVML